jgi:hypothetical protein
MEDPYVIEVGVSYGGCAAPLQEPGPLHRVDISESGSYTVTQSNGVTDLEIWIYDDSAEPVFSIDEEWGGVDESDSAEVEAGTYYIEVYNNGAAMGTGDQEGPYTLTVSGPN